MPNNKTTKKETKVQKPKKETGIEKLKAMELTEEVVLRYLCPQASATKNEIVMFLNQCAMFELNPFKREIYLIKYSQSDPATFVLGFEAFLKRAERAGKLTGWRAWTEGTIMTKDFKAIVEIHRKDWKHPFVHEVYWDEYKQEKRDGTLTVFWKNKPRTMLKKVVISQGMRMCFPDELGGMPYTQEEMPIDHEKLPTEEIITVVPEEEKPKKETKKKEEPKEKPKEEVIKEYEESVEKEKEKMSAVKPPEPESEPESDAPPEPEEETPEPPKEEPKEEEKEGPDPGDPISAQTKRFIANALTELEKDYGRDPADIGNKVADRIERLFSTKKLQVKVEKFPDDITEFQGRRVLEWLEVTRGKEEEKRK